jgi:AraC-like DNA-binding protein
MQPMPLTSSRMPPSATGAIARLAADRVAAAGVDPGPLLRKAGLPLAAIRDPDTRVDAAAQAAFLNLAAEALPDPLLGFRLAQGFEPREAGLLYFVLASSATLGDALARAARYSTIANEGIELQAQAGAELDVRYTYSGLPRHSDRHQMEFWAVLLVRLAQRLTGTTVRPVRVSFRHPRCEGSNQLDAFFGCKVDFTDDRDEVAFTRTAANLTLPGAEPYLNRLLVRYCEEALSRRAPPTSPLRASVENAIAPLLPHGQARVDAVARTLGMSQRTLARRLAAENLNFLGIREEMRRDLARHYLADPELSVSRIAWLLGFQEVSAFTHAFRRWTGMSPTEMRAAPIVPSAEVAS